MKVSRKGPHRPIVIFRHTDGRHYLHSLPPNPAAELMSTAEFDEWQRPFLAGQLAPGLVLDCPTTAEWDAFAREQERRNKAGLPGMTPKEGGRFFDDLRGETE